MQLDQDLHHLFYLFGLRFYGPVNPFRSCQAQSVYLTTLFPGQVYTSKWLTSTCAHSYTQKLRNCRIYQKNSQKKKKKTRRKQGVWRNGPSSHSAEAYTKHLNIFYNLLLQIRCFFQPIITDILCLHKKNIYCGYSLKVPCQGALKEYPWHM